MTADAPPTKPPGRFSRARLNELFTNYGQTALVTYFTIFFGTLGAFWLALKFGFDIGTDPSASMGTVAAAYVATKLTQPARIGATVVLTPFVHNLWARFRSA